MKKIISTLIITLASTWLFVMPISAASFDPSYYAAQNPDVVAVYGTDANALYQHYLNNGKAEGRLAYAGAQKGENVSAPTGQTTVQTRTKEQVAAEIENCRNQLTAIDNIAYQQDATYKANRDAYDAQQTAIVSQMVALDKEYFGLTGAYYYKNYTTASGFTLVAPAIIYTSGGPVAVSSVQVSDITNRIGRYSYTLNAIQRSSVVNQYRVTMNELSSAGSPMRSTSYTWESGCIGISPYGWAVTDSRKISFKPTN